MERSQEELAALSRGGKMGSASRGAWHCLKLEECRAFSSINRAWLLLERRSAGRRGGFVTARALPAAAALG